MGSWGGKRTGAGRKPKVAGEKRKALSVTIAERNWDHARAIAERSGQTLSEVVDAMLAAAATLPAFNRLLHTDAPAQLERVVPMEGNEGLESVVESDPQRQIL
jgi:hypothetical protein